MKRTKNLGAIITAAALLFAACETPINNNNNNNEDQEQEQEQEQEKAQQQEYTVTVNSNITGGRMIPAPEKAKEGDTVILVAAPAVYYTLAGAPVVSADNNQVELSGNGQSEPYSFIMPAANVTVLPSFAIHSSHNILPIYSGSDLALIGATEAYPLNGIYQLQNNITLPDDWAPIGDGTRVFSGIFDGTGKTITVNTFLYEDEDEPLAYTGIFGFTVAATIKNLTLNLNQAEAQPQGANFGFLVGYAAYSELQNISVSGDFEINLDNTIQYSAGTIAGVLDHSQLLHSNINGELTVSRRNVENTPGSTFYNNIGGLAGFVTNSSIRECGITGNVTITSLFMRAGGIAGNVEQSAMTANSMVGNFSGISVNNYNDATSGSSTVTIGGLAGYFANGSITNNSFDGDLLADLGGSATTGVMGNTQVGGVIGNITQQARADSLSFKGDIEFKIAGSMPSRSCLIGGIAGLSDGDVQIQNSSFGGEISVFNGLLSAPESDFTLSTGGIIGSARGATIKGSYASGVITATNEDTSGTPIGAIARTHTGGIAGYFNAYVNEIDSCYFTGSITSNGKYPNVGGILGLGYNGSSTENKITRSYAFLENVLAIGSEKRPSGNSGTDGSLRITAGGIVGRCYTTNGTSYTHRNTVEYCAALYDNSNSSLIKAEGNTENQNTLYAGSIVGNRLTTTGVPGGTLTANITNFPATDPPITPYIADSDSSPGNNGEYVADITQERFFGSTDDGGLGWDHPGVWTWDSVKGLPKLAWQQN
jgi:hypothetical protein